MTQNERDITIRNWMQEYGRLIYSVAYKILLNEQDAEDVFQNTFSKAYFKINRLSRHQNIKAWLCLTAKNDSLNKVKSSWKKKVSLIEAPPDIAGYVPEAIDLSSLIKELPAIYRQTIWLHYYAGYKTDEISKLMEVSPSTVRSRLKRGRLYLKEGIQNLQGRQSYEHQ